MRVDWGAMIPVIIGLLRMEYSKTNFQMVLGLSIFFIIN